LSVADRGIVIKRGEVTLEGSAAALRADPEVSAAYLGALAAPVNKE
jgi:ABC-type branched-subunit amino acid transport system ATPase component